jgi:hypothetical protein
MPTYWITAYTEENHIVVASSEEEAREMVYDGTSEPRGERIAQLSIDQVKDDND